MHHVNFSNNGRSTEDLQGRPISQVNMMDLIQHLTSIAPKKNSCRYLMTSHVRKLNRAIGLPCVEEVSLLINKRPSL